MARNQFTLHREIPTDWPYRNGAHLFPELPPPPVYQAHRRCIVCLQDHGVSAMFRAPIWVAVPKDAWLCGGCLFVLVDASADGDDLVCTAEHVTIALSV